MAFDPYAILGLRKNASPEDITRAYHGKAKDAHPDQGGKPEEFHALRRAVAILRDPIRREKFDKTGSVDELPPSNIDQGALEIISHLVQQALDAEPDPLCLDMVATLKSILGNAVSAIEADVRKIRRARDRAERMKTRFTRKAKKAKAKGDDRAPEDMMAKMMAWQIVNLDRRLAGPEDALAKHKRAVEMLDEYQFMPDAAHMTGTTSTGGLFFPFAQQSIFTIR